MQRPKRIAIIGLPGSGKSTFAAKLGGILHIPVHHLDSHQFVRCGKKREKQEFLLIQEKILGEESWIIEGCSFSTIEMRFARADTLIYFFFPRYLCVWRMIKRLFNHEKTFGGLRIINLEVLKYMWNFDKEKRKRIEELRKKYPKVQFYEFKNGKEASLFLLDIM